MLGLFYPQYRCHFIVAFIFISICPGGILTLRNSSSFTSQYSVGRSSRSTLSDGIHSISSSSADGSLSTTSRTFQSSILGSSRRTNHSRWTLHNDSSGTIQSQNTIVNGRTFSEKPVHTVWFNATKETHVQSSVEAHAQSSEVLSTPMVELPSSSGVITSPIVSSAWTESRLDTLASSLEVSPTFVKKEQSSGDIPSPNVSSAWSESRLYTLASSLEVSPTFAKEPSSGVITSPIVSLARNGSRLDNWRNRSTTLASSLEVSPTFAKEPSSGVITSPIVSLAWNGSRLDNWRNRSTTLASSLEVSPTFAKEPSSGVITSTIVSLAWNGSRLDNWRNRSTTLASSLEVSPTFTRKEPSSGVTTSPIVSSAWSESRLDNWRNRSITLVSSLEVSPTFVMKEQSSSAEDQGTETTTINESNLMSAKTFTETQKSSEYIVSSEIQTLPSQETTATTSNSSYNIASLKMMYSTTAHHSNSSSSVSPLKIIYSTTANHSNETPSANYGHLTTVKSFLRTLEYQAVITSGSSEFRTRVSEDIVSQTNNGTSHKSSGMSVFTRTSLKVDITSSIQPLKERQTPTSKSSQLAPSPTLTVTYNSHASLIHATSPQSDLSTVVFTAGNIKHNSSATKISNASLSQLLPSFLRSRKPEENTVYVTQGGSLSLSSHPTNALYNMISSKLSNVPFASYSTLNSVKNQNTSTMSTQPASLGASRRETVMQNSYLSSVRTNIRPTSVAGRKSKAYTLQAIESQESSHSQTSVKIEKSTLASKLIRTNELSVLKDSVHSMLSRASSSWRIVSSLVHQSVLSYTINVTIQTSKQETSSITASKGSLHDKIHRTASAFSIPMSSSKHISNTVISKSAPNVSPSTIISPSLSDIPRSLVTSSHGLTSIAFHSNFSRISSSKISSSKTVGYSVIPIMEPCYISYVITITQRLGLPSISSGTILQNISSSSDYLSVNFTLQPSTTSTDAQFNMASQSISEYQFQTKSSFKLQRENQTMLSLEPTNAVASSHFHSLTMNTSLNTQEVTASYDTSRKIPIISTISSRKILIISTFSSGKIPIISTISSRKIPTISTVEATPTIRSNFSIFSKVMLSIVKNLSVATRPITTYQRTLEPTPSMNSSVPYSLRITSSLESLQITGVRTTPVVSYSLHLFSSRFHGNSRDNSNEGTATLSSRTQHERSIPLPVTPSPSLMNTSSFNMQTSMKEDVASSQYTKFVRFSTDDIQNPRNSTNATLSTTQRNHEISASVLQLSSTMSTLAINPTTLLKTTKSKLPNKTWGVLSRDASTESKDSSPKSVPTLAFPTPVLSNISTSAPVAITSDGAILTILTLPSLLVNTSLSEPTLHSPSKSTGSLSTLRSIKLTSVHLEIQQSSPATTVSPTSTIHVNTTTISESLLTESLSTTWTGKLTSALLASHNLSSTEFGIWQRTPATTISPTLTIHVNKTTISESLSTESLSTTWTGKLTSVLLTSHNLSSTAFGIWQRSPATTISPTLTIHVNKTTISESLSTESLSTTWTGKLTSVLLTSHNLSSTEFGIWQRSPATTISPTLTIHVNKTTISESLSIESLSTTWTGKLTSVLLTSHNLSSTEFGIWQRSPATTISPTLTIHVNKTTISASLSIESLSTTRTGKLTSVLLASHNLSLTEFGIRQSSPTTTISPTPTIHVNKTTTSESLSTESLSTTRTGKLTSVPLVSHNLSSTEFGIWHRSPATTISLTSTININKTTANESLLSETIVLQSVYTKKSQSTETLNRELSPISFKPTLLTLAVNTPRVTLSNSSHSVTVKSRVPTNNRTSGFGSPQAHFSTSKMSWHSVGQTTSIITPINFRTSSEPDPSAAFSYPFHSSSISIGASLYHSSSISPLMSETTSLNTTYPTRRKRRNVEIFPLFTNESSTAALRGEHSATITVPTKSWLLQSVVISISPTPTININKTTTNESLSSETTMTLNGEQNSSSFKPVQLSSAFLKHASAVVGGEMSSELLATTLGPTKSLLTKTSVYQAIATMTVNAVQNSSSFKPVQLSSAFLKHDSAVEGGKTSSELLAMTPSPTKSSLTKTSVYQAIATMTVSVNAVQNSSSFIAVQLSSAFLKHVSDLVGGEMSSELLAMTPGPTKSSLTKTSVYQAIATMTANTEQNSSSFKPVQLSSAFLKHDIAVEVGKTSSELLAMTPSPTKSSLTKTSVYQAIATMTVNAVQNSSSFKPVQLSSAFLKHNSDLVGGEMSSELLAMTPGPTKSSLTKTSVYQAIATMTANTEQNSSSFKPVQLSSAFLKHDIAVEVGKTSSELLAMTPSPTKSSLTKTSVYQAIATMTVNAVQNSSSFKPVQLSSAFLKHDSDLVGGKTSSELLAMTPSPTKSSLTKTSVYQAIATMTVNAVQNSSSFKPVQLSSAFLKHVSDLVGGKTSSELLAMTPSPTKSSLTKTSVYQAIATMTVNAVQNSSSFKPVQLSSAFLKHDIAVEVGKTSSELLAMTPSPTKSSLTKTSVYQAIATMTVNAVQNSSSFTAVQLSSAFLKHVSDLVGGEMSSELLAMTPGPTKSLTKTSVYSSNARLPREIEKIKTTTMSATSLTSRNTSTVNLHSSTKSLEGISPVEVVLNSSGTYSPTFSKLNQPPTTITSSPTVLNTPYNTTTVLQGIIATSTLASRNISYFPTRTNSAPVVSHTTGSSIMNTSYSRATMGISAGISALSLEAIQNSISRKDLSNGRSLSLVSQIPSNSSKTAAVFVFSTTCSMVVESSPAISRNFTQPSSVNISRATIPPSHLSSSQETSTKLGNSMVISKSYFAITKSKVLGNSSEKFQLPSTEDGNQLSSTDSTSIITQVIMQTARNSRIQESSTPSSFRAISTARSSPITGKIATVAPSPSLTLTSAKKGELRSTPNLSLTEEVSSYVIPGTRNYSKNLNSSGKLLISKTKTHRKSQSNVISSAINSSVQLATASSMVTTSAVEKATSYTPKLPTTPLFTYHLIPTSRLGSCIVGYSTVYLSNVTDEISTTTAVTPGNTSAALYSPVLVTKTSQTSSVLFLNKSNSFVVNITSSATMSLHLNLSSSTTFHTKLLTSSAVDRINNSTVVTPSLSKTRNIDVSKIFNGSTTLHPLTTSQRRSSFSMPAIIASPTLHQASASVPISSVQTASHTVDAIITTNSVINASVSTISVAPSLSSSYSSVIPSSSVIPTSVPTGSPVDNDYGLIMIVLAVPVNVDVTKNQFKEAMEDKLNSVYQKGRQVQTKRRKRRADLDTSVKVKNVNRENGERVDVSYIVIDNNKTLSAEDAASTMNVFAVDTLSTLMGYQVLERPKPVSKGFTTKSIVAMLVKTDSQRNISSPLVKKSFENELVNFYNKSRKEPRGRMVNAIVTYTYFEPLQRTYLEFAITVNDVAVNQSILLQVFDVAKNILTANLKQVVLVPPYIPSSLKPTVHDYIIQSMIFNGANNTQAINQLSTKLSQVYLAAKQKVSRKRRKRALGSIDTKITNISPQKNAEVDVTYYVIDGGSVLNATHACSILNRLSSNEMTLITAPYVVNNSPRPVKQPSTSKTSVDDSYPPWMIPVIAAGSVGLLLLILIIILYCRWKKGAPSKKIQPGVAPRIEEQRDGPRITHASDPEERRDLRRHPTPIPTAVPTEANNNTRSSVRPPVRKLPVRENSLRKKVSSRDSLITSQITKTNPAFVEDDENESVIDQNGAQSKRQQTKAQVAIRKEGMVPRIQEPPPSVQEPLESEEESETEASDGESVYTDGSLRTGKTDQNSPAALPTVAVMSDTRPSEKQPPVRFRTSVHPEASLPPIDLKQTSLVGRIVEEEGPLQKEMNTKTDIERWRNKQRQREKKKLGESQSKRGQRPSFTEKKAWSRAQQEIGSVLDPDVMQPIVRKKKRKPRRKYDTTTETTDEESNVKLRGFQKLESPRETKQTQHEQDSQSDSDISMGEARRRMISLLDDAFASMKSSSKKHSSDAIDQPDGKTNTTKPQRYPPSGYRPPLHPRPTPSTTALLEPPPAHGRATAPSARHRRRFLDSQNSLPYPSHYYPGNYGRAPYPPPQTVVTKNPVVVWDPADKRRLLNQSSYRPYPGHPYTYSDTSGKLHFTPVQHTPDGMGGLVWSPYATEYAMDDFYRNVKMPETLPNENETFLSQMQETPLSSIPESTAAPHHTVIDMGGSGITNENGSMTGQSAEPLVRAIKDELFRLSNGRTPVKHY